MANELTVTTFETREQWLQARRGWIGASDSVSILGMSRYGSPLSIWAEKVKGVQVDSEESELARWGTILEAPVREEYARLTGRKVNYAGQWAVVGEGNKRATLDGEIEDPANGIYEGKTANAYLAREWQDEAPLRYQIQGQHQLMVTGREWVSIAVLIGGNKLKWYDIARDDRFIEALQEHLDRFWGYVVRQEEPPVTESENDLARNALSALHPVDKGHTVVLPASMLETHNRLHQIKTQMKMLKAQQAFAENQLRQAIGDATYGMIEGGPTYSLKTVKRAGYTVQATEYRTLHCMGGSKAIEGDE